MGGLPSAKGLPLLIVRDLIEPEVRQLSVVARHVSREPKGVLLDLPADGDSARLIRDPFSVASAAPSTVGGAFAANRMIASLLFGVQPTDAATMAAVIATISTVAAVACWLPGWRASRLDPNVVLRGD